MPFVPKKVMERLLLSAEMDDTLMRCEECGAWFYSDEPGACSVDDLRGCWWMATQRASDVGTCFRGKGAYRMVGAYGMTPGRKPHALVEDVPIKCSLGYKCPEGPHGACCGEPDWEGEG